MSKPPLAVTVFSDYICPFCYIGSVRLARLREEYELSVDWVGLEIHPDNPPEGRPVEALAYAPEQWAQMMSALYQMAEEEGVYIKPRSFTTNSHKALLLAEAAKEEGESIFYRLHDRLFQAYLGEGQNIGQLEVLRLIARESGMEAHAAERAWSEPYYEQRLHASQIRAARLGITGTPTYLIGERYLVPGAVPVSVLREAAATCLKRSPAS